MNKNGYLSILSLISLFVVFAIVLFVGNFAINTLNTTNICFKHSRNHYLVLASFERIKSIFMYDVNFDEESVYFGDISQTVWIEEISCNEDPPIILGPKTLTDQDDVLQFNIEYITDISITISPTTQYCVTSVYHIRDGIEFLIGEFNTEQEIFIAGNSDEFACGTYAIQQQLGSATVTVEHPGVITRVINVSNKINRVLQVQSGCPVNKIQWGRLEGGSFRGVPL